MCLPAVFALPPLDVAAVVAPRRLRRVAVLCSARFSRSTKAVFLFRKLEINIHKDTLKWIRPLLECKMCPRELSTH